MISIKPIENIEALRELHGKMVAPYLFDKSDFVLSAGVFNGSGTPRIAMMGRPALEVYALIDHGWATARERLSLGSALSQHFENDARANGFVQLFATIPPQIEKSFAKRMFAHGWAKQLWPCYSKELI